MPYEEDKLSVEKGSIDIAKLGAKELLEKIESGEIKSESYTMEEYYEKFSNHLGKYAHIIEIRKDDHIVKIHYNYNVHLDQVLAFEGKRLQSLHARNLNIIPFEERVWDKERKITVSKRE